MLSLIQFYEVGIKLGAASRAGSATGDRDLPPDVILACTSVRIQVPNHVPFPVDIDKKRVAEIPERLGPGHDLVNTGFGDID